VSAVGRTPARARAERPDRQQGPRGALGRLGENLAAAHFEQLGFEQLARNVRTRAGEIDLVAFDGVTLVFVEVKTRRVGARRVGAEHQPLAGLRATQRARLRRLASAWLQQTPGRPSARAIRFDAIGVIVDRKGVLRELRHLEDAF